MDPSTITLLVGIISCVIGVSTFVTGRMAKAEHNGSMETKITQALDGITAINRKLEEFSHSQHEVDLLVREHDANIKTLFRRIDELRVSMSECNQNHEILKDLAQAVANMGGGEYE